MFKLKLPFVSFFFILFSSICYGADYLPDEGGDIEPPPAASIDMYVSFMLILGILLFLHFTYYENKIRFKK